MEAAFAELPLALFTTLAPMGAGAFIVLGCLIAWKNWIEARAAARQQRRTPSQPAPAAS